MSLDVYLTLESAKIHYSGSGIFVRKDGQRKEISREEWDEKFPGREPVIVVCQESESDQVYSANITHNLGGMADRAGIYDYLWRPDEINISHARQLVDPLRQGLSLLESDPEHFKVFNPRNGLGTYEVLVEFVRNYLNACENYPDAEVSVGR